MKARKIQLWDGAWYSVGHQQLFITWGGVVENSGKINLLLFLKGNGLGISQLTANEAGIMRIRQSLEGGSGKFHCDTTKNPLNPPPPWR